MYNKDFAGWHLTYDGFVSEQNVSRLRDVDFVSSVLVNMISFLDMGLYPAPEITSAYEQDSLSAFCMMLSGHVSIHTWPLRSRFSLDVFSSEKFDEGDVISYVTNSMGAERRSTHFLVRTWT